MGDNLGDEWWKLADSAKEKLPKAVSENAVAKSKKRKKQSVDAKPITDEVLKKRKKKKNISTVLISQEPAPLMPDHLISAVLEHCRNKQLSPVEMDELTLHREQHFAMCNDMTHTATSYLKMLVPHWKRVAKNAGSSPGSPAILIVCSGGLRAVQFIREISDFKVGGCKIAKLFAKHFKLAEQAKFLKKTVVHIAVGTPKRLTQLLDSGCLHLDAVKHVVIDWSHRDVKQRRIIDMRETRTDLMDLLCRHVIPHVKSVNSARLALY